MWKWLGLIAANILAVVLACRWGAAAGISWTDGKYKKYVEKTKLKNTCEVTIYWDEDGVRSDTIEVRKDLNWGINGDYEGSYSYGLYYVETNPSSPLWGVEDKMPKGKTKFAGLWTSAYGGTQVVNSAGYSLMQITEDCALYAVWE